MLHNKDALIYLTGTIPTIYIQQTVLLPLALYSLSQDHRTVEVGWDLWRSLCLTLLLKQGQPQLVAQGCVQIPFEDFQAWRFYSLPGQPVPVLLHSHSKNVFLNVLKEPPVFQCVPTAPGPVKFTLCYAKNALFLLPKFSSPFICYLICMKKKKKKQNKTDF